MSVVLGLVLPIAWLACCAFLFPTTWYAWALLVAYVLATLLSRTVQRVGRAGFVPACASAPVVVGGGWSWVLRGGRPPNRVSCRAGRVGTTDWWHAGTTIGDVQRALAREHRTLAGHPSILSATLGGWIASRSHGTGGSLWTPTMGELEVEEVDGGARRVLASKRDFVPGAMIVRTVRLHSVPNVVCERRAVDVTDRRVAGELLSTPTYLRAVFVDRYRSLAFLWVPTESEALDRERFPPPWLAVILPARWRRRLRFPPRRVTLREANRFAPIEPPLLLATPAIALRINFEIFVTHPTTADVLWRLCRAFRDLFASGAVSGRMELRFGAAKQFLDLDLARRWDGDYDAVFHCVRAVYGPDVAFALHPGKAQCRVPPLIGST